VKSIRPSGEGALKKSFELLKEKLDKEGLFAPQRKRQLPTIPKHIAVISSTDAAGYADFIKIINDRWGGLHIDVAHVQVQGAAAPDQIIRAIQYFNGQEVLPEVLVIIRGGGSADDLASFNDELLVRAIAASRIPTLVGVGHEIDESLADMVADVRAATPSNAAQILVPDKNELIRASYQVTGSLVARMTQIINQQSAAVKDVLRSAFETLNEKLDDQFDNLRNVRSLLIQLNPETVLARGYALLRGQQKVGESIEVETSRAILKAEVTHVNKK
jgi:exodeoxyribonuclease VII large subunit